MRAALAIIRQASRECQITRLMFGITASSFAANMVLKQIALDFQQEYPKAARATQDCFYVDDGLIGADSADDAIRLREELQHSFPWKDSHSGNGGLLIQQLKRIFQHTFVIKNRYN